MGISVLCVCRVAGNGVVKDIINLASIQDHILNRSTAPIHTLYLDFSLLRRNGQLTMGNKALLSPSSTFQATLVWQSTAAAAQKEITGFHQSDQEGMSGATTHSFKWHPLVQSTDSQRGGLGGNGKKTLTFISFFLLPSYLPLIPYNNPEGKCHCPILQRKNWRLREISQTLSVISGCDFKISSLHYNITDSLCIIVNIYVIYWLGDRPQQQQQEQFLMFPCARHFIKTGSFNNQNNQVR